MKVAGRNRGCFCASVAGKRDPPDESPDRKGHPPVEATTRQARQRRANLDSQSVGVRWQQQMEDHLTSVRQMTSEAMLPGVAQDQADVRAQLAQAHATAALALSIGNTGSDLELAITRLREEVG